MSADALVAAQVARVIRRVKSSMNYHGSYTTRDILGCLIARWLHSGEWARLKGLPADQRHVGESVRRFVLDRLDQMRRRGHREDPDMIDVVPDASELHELVELAELRAWIEARVEELIRGDVDPRVRVPLVHPDEIGRALRMHLDGTSQRAIATALGVSLGVANKRIADGVRYLVLLQTVEEGVA